MKKLQALETYQQLMADSTTGPIDKQLQRRAGDTPAEVSGKIAADKDEIDLLAAAVLIAQVCQQLPGKQIGTMNSSRGLPFLSL